MTLEKNVQRLMRNVKNRLKTFSKHGVYNTKSSELLEQKLHIIKGDSKNLYRVDHSLSAEQLKEMEIALKQFQTSNTFNQYKKAGKKIAQEIYGRKRVTEEESLNAMQLSKQADEYLRDEIVYEVIAPQMIDSIIQKTGGEVGKIRLMNALKEQGKHNMDLAETLDRMGLDIDDL